MSYETLFHQNLLTNIHKPIHFCILICSVIIQCLYSYSISSSIAMFFSSLTFFSVTTLPNPHTHTRQTLQNPHIHTHTHILQTPPTHSHPHARPHIRKPPPPTHTHITKQFNTTTVQIKTNTVQDTPKWNRHSIINTFSTRSPECKKQFYP
jgi:hypothetical protein